MTAEQRRQDIILAAIPLLVEQGLKVSTKQIADAAGVAEGTLFRVFPTKRDLIRQAAQVATDPGRLTGVIDDIPKDQPLLQRIEAIVKIFLTTTDQVRSLMMIFHSPEARARYGPDLDHPGPPGPPGPKGGGKDHREWSAQSETVRQAIVRLLEPDAAHLVVDIDTAAAYIRAVGFAIGFPPVVYPELHQPAVVAGLIQRGITACCEEYRAACEEYSQVLSQGTDYEDCCQVLSQDAGCEEYRQAPSRAARLGGQNGVETDQIDRNNSQNQNQPEVPSRDEPVRAPKGFRPVRSGEG